MVGAGCLVSKICGGIFFVQAVVSNSFQVSRIMAAPKEISMAAVRFLSPTPEVIAQFPNAAKCTVYVPISNLKRELVGSSPFKPTSKIDFDAAEKFRFVKTPARTGSRASFCYIHALGCK